MLASRSASECAPDSTKPHDYAFRTKKHEYIWHFPRLFVTLERKQHARMEKHNIINYQYYTSPCGKLVLYSFNGRLCMCNWEDSHDQSSASLALRRELKADFEQKPTAVILEARRQLTAYFRRKSETLKVPLLLVGTEFQKRVWKSLTKIPYGKTITYGDLARELGAPTATRAVAKACSENILSLFLPCHRVVGKNGQLQGYSGGLDVKRFLLDLEDNTLFMPEFTPQEKENES